MAKPKRVLVTGIREGKKPWLTGLASSHGTLWLDFSQESGEGSSLRNHGIEKLISLFPHLNLEGESFLTYDMGELLGRYMLVPLRELKKGG